MNEERRCPVPWRRCDMALTRPNWCQWECICRGCPLEYPCEIAWGAMPGANRELITDLCLVRLAAHEGRKHRYE